MSAETEVDIYRLSEVDDWPNCAIPDCEYKSCRSLNSPLCYAHTNGRNPSMSFEEYMRTGTPQ